jgi:hypothetical protein
MGYEVFARTPLLGTGFVTKDSPYWEKHISQYGNAVTYCADYGLPRASAH